MKKAHAPQIEGLSLAEILVFIREHPVILEYLPEEEEITRPGREFICNIAYTIEPDDFTAFVRSKEQLRRQKLDDMQRNTVRLHLIDVPIDPNPSDVCAKIADDFVGQRRQGNCSFSMQARHEAKTQQASSCGRQRRGGKAEGKSTRILA